MSVCTIAKATTPETAPQNVLDFCKPPQRLCARCTYTEQRTQSRPNNTLTHSHNMSNNCTQNKSRCYVSVPYLKIPHLRHHLFICVAKHNAFCTKCNTFAQKKINFFTQNRRKIHWLGGTLLSCSARGGRV